MSSMKAAQRAKRDAMFLKGPVTFGWVNLNIPDPTSRLILVAEAYMKMATPALKSQGLELCRDREPRSAVQGSEED